MTAIASNGTGGGVVSAGASWAGGVAPAEGDTCTIASGDTITIDANWTVGADSATAAIDVLSGGTLDWDGGGAADVVTCKGNFYVRNGGTLTLDGTADVTKTLTIKLNYSATLSAGEYGMIVEDGAIVSLQGFNKTRSWDTLSADALNGQKNVVTTNDNSAVWYAGDTFAVGSMTRIGTTGVETDTIASFSTTTITKTGANYSYVHDEDVAIINLTRNITITAYNTTYNGYILLSNTTLGNFDCDWVAFSYLGVNTSSKNAAITFAANTARADLVNCSFYNVRHAVYAPGTSTLNIDNCVIYVTAAQSIYGVNLYIGTVTDTVVFASSSYTDYGAYTGATLTGNHYANSTNGLQGRGILASITNIKIYGIVGIGATFDSGASGFTLGNVTFDNCGAALSLAGSAITMAAGAMLTFGGTVANAGDIQQAGYENTIRVNTTTLTVTITGGRLSAYDASANHRTWYAYGSFSKSTTNPRSGTHTLRMLPTGASNALIATSTVPASNGVQIVVSAYFQKNAAYGSGNEPYLRLSGAGVTTDTDAMADTSGAWQLLTVAGTPTEDGFCKVEFVTQSAGVGAAVDIDDVKMVYTAIDTGSMTYWFEGDLPTVLMSTGLGATDVWAAATAGMTAAGSIGKLLTDDINATISSRSTLTQADILSDATPFAGGNIDATISSRSTLAQADILSDTTPFAGADIDAAISSRAAPGDAMTLTAAYDPAKTAAQAGDAMTLTAAYDPAKTAAQAGDAMALTAGERNSTAAAILDLASAIETNLTLREALRLIAAATAGKLSGAATATITIRNARADDTNRIIATVDADGNRTAIVYDVS